MSTFLTADSHFFHGSMLKFCPDTRPYANVAEMNNAMASAWRKVVKPTDEVIVVGDFSHRAEPKALRKLFDSLPGRKHLIIGNHDGPDTLALPWESVRDVACVTIDNTYCVLAHYPWRSWPRMKRGALMLFGHHHGRMPGNQQSCDVGVDVFGPAPVRLNQIKAHLTTLPPLVDPEGGDDFENDGLKP
ncbi:metallophosphoesterase [Bradyrhizobium sp. SBR1B]|uniref:metallophosphoesterase n=1 Tax=Bradyrhizobium sp. SBR1B TaxID=2663836 RepID=UPI0016068498|nr:metallophosphoesterase [Bradyrhizobium sp. SBR1B]MBB4377236.1 calcineurin-like phosphoesterase family protein [Bradyrhizobium sp. SBR1B]